MGLGELLEHVRSVNRDDSWQLTDTDLAASVLELSAVIHQLEALRFRLLNDMHDRGAVPSGYTGAAAWLACTTVLSNREAVRIEKRADALRSNREVAEAYESGRIGVEHATLITTFLERPPAAMPDDAVPAALEFLLDAGEDRDTWVLRAAMTRLTDLFDTDTPPRPKILSATSCSPPPL